MLQTPRTHSRTFWSCVAALGVLTAPGSAHAVATRTYGLVVRAYCEPGTFCGHPTEQALENHVRNQMRLINEVWRPTGVSFRFAGFHQRGHLSQHGIEQVWRGQ